MTVCGTVQIHSAIAALRPHVQWAVEASFGMPIALRWQEQSALLGNFKCEFPWRGVPKLVDELGSNLISCKQVRFEIIQDATAGTLGRRVCYTPALGLFNGVTNELGDIVVDENQLTKAILTSQRSDIPLATMLSKLIGKPWDEELDVFRYADEQVRWLQAVN